MASRLQDQDYGRYIASPEQIIEACRVGEMFILVDAEDRENVSGLMIPAEFAGAEAINFMARFGRGLVCLALTGERVEELGLPLMAPQARRDGTSFTISIEAREGVSTGISAADRARTIAVAIDRAFNRNDLVTPGHVFPLRACDGGVLMRAGHTEAAVDFARFAGLAPAGVICEIMNDDGSMARLHDLIPFAERHGLLIGTITDLIAYRRRTERTIEQIAEYPFNSVFGGDWCARIFRAVPDGTEHLALVKGQIDPSAPTLVRMHALSLFSDILGEKDGRPQQLQAAMSQIGEAGSGAVVILRDSPVGGPASIISEKDGSARIRSGDIGRDYGIGAQIVNALGVRRMVLLTNSPKHDLAVLDGFDLSVVEERPIRFGSLSLVEAA